MDDIANTITHPWREPMDYVSLAFWVVIFMIVAFIIADALRILVMWTKQAV